VKDTKSNRSIFQLQVSVLPIGEKESGLLPSEKMLPTPTATERSGINPKTGKGAGLSKTVQQLQPKMWATPNTMDHLPPRSEEGTKKLMEGQRKGRTSPSNLREQVDPKTMEMYQKKIKIMWPTPTTKGFGHASEGQTMIMRRKVEAGELTEPEAKAMLNGTTLRPPRLKEWMWPTPRASAAMSEDVSNIKERGVDKGRLEERVAQHKEAKDGGALNPTWVEWLMGYPAEYTVLKDWAILSSRKLSKKSVKP